MSTNEKPITTDQIIAMNSLLADYVISPTRLMDCETDLVQYIRLDTPPSVILSAIRTANEHGMLCYARKTGNTLMITSWRNR